MDETENKNVENEEVIDTIKTIREEYEKKFAEQLEKHAKEIKELEDKMKRDHNEQLKALLSGTKVISQIEQKEVEEEDEVQSAIKRLTEKFNKRGR